MKYKFNILLLNLITFVFSVSQVHAQASSVGLSGISKYNSLEEVIIALVSLVRPIVVIAFVGMITYGGWVYLTSQGNADKVKNAKQIIGAAIAGFVIIVIAPSVVELLASILGVNPNLVRVR